MCTALHSLHRTVTDQYDLSVSLMMSKHFYLPKLYSGCELFSHGLTWSFSGTNRESDRVVIVM